MFMLDEYKVNLKRINEDFVDVRFLPISALFLAISVLVRW